MYLESLSAVLFVPTSSPRLGHARERLPAMHPDDVLRDQLLGESYDERVEATRNLYLRARRPVNAWAARMCKGFTEKERLAVLKSVIDSFLYNRKYIAESDDLVAAACRVAFVHVLYASENIRWSRARAAIIHGSALHSQVVSHPRPLEPAP